MLICIPQASISLYSSQTVYYVSPGISGWLKSLTYSYCFQGKVKILLIQIKNENATRQKFTIWNIVLCKIRFFSFKCLPLVFLLFNIVICHMYLIQQHCVFKHLLTRWHYRFGSEQKWSNQRGSRFRTNTFQHIYKLIQDISGCEKWNFPLHLHTSGIISWDNKCNQNT